MNIDDMKTTSHQVNLFYTREELMAIFDVPNAEDVEKGGRYDARGGAINVWSHHWTHPGNTSGVRNARHLLRQLGRVYDTDD